MDTFFGDEMATVELPVRGSAWRTYSYKTIPPQWAGDWVVKVVDANDNVLKAIPFKVGNGSVKTVTTEKAQVEEKVKATADDLAPAKEKAETEVEKVQEEVKEVVDSVKVGQ